MLLVITVLNVDKAQGPTLCGWRKQDEARARTCQAIAVGCVSGDDAEGLTAPASRKSAFTGACEESTRR